MDNTNNTNEIKYIPMYKSYIDAVAQLNNEDRLAIYEAIFNYGFTGEEPTFENPYLAMGWNLVKPNLVNNINNAIKNQKNGNKGGRPKKINDGVEPSKPSTENKAPESTIITQPIPEVHVEEIVSKKEDNIVINNKKEDMRVKFESEMKYSKDSPISPAQFHTLTNDYFLDKLPYKNFTGLKSNDFEGFWNRIQELKNKINQNELV